MVRSVPRVNNLLKGNFRKVKVRISLRRRIINLLNPLLKVKKRVRNKSSPLKRT